MHLSHLQRFILLESREQPKSRTGRSAFLAYYLRAEASTHVKDQQDAITKSMERLIDRGYLTGYGRRTPKKWFIEEVRLTPKGKRAAQKLLGEQQQLPFRATKR